MRLFIGLEPTPGFARALSAAQDALRAAGVRGRYLPPSNLHLTLAFIGEWAADVSPLLPPVARPFSLSLSRPGVFPGAAVLWAGVAPSDELNALAARVRQTLTENGVPFDAKPFFPHITLARRPVIPETVRLDAVPLPSDVLTVRQTCLYWSHREADGLVYSVIGRSE